MTSIHFRIPWSAKTRRSLSREQQVRVRPYLVECTVSTVKNHLEGDVGPILDAWDPCCGGHDVDASRRAIASEVTNHQLVGTRSGMEVTK